MIDGSARARPKDRSRLKWPVKPARAKRVAGVVVDQHVACSRCGNLMHLSANHTFLCKQCGWEVAAEDAIKVLEAPAATWNPPLGRPHN